MTRTRSGCTGSAGRRKPQRDMFTVGIVLTENVVDFTVADLTVSNGEATALRENGQVALGG